LVSNTWSLNKEAIPDFLMLLEKLRDKYMDVLGDSKLMSLLEEAEHRAHELQVSDEAVGEGVKSSVVFSHGGSGMCMGEYPLSLGIRIDSDGDEIDPYEMYFEDEYGSFSHVEDKKRARRGIVGNSASRFIKSAPEGVDPGMYDDYVQQLVQRGIPEDQARQLADNLVAQMRRDIGNFAASVQTGGGVSQSAKGRIIKSEGDVIVNQDDDDEDGGGDGGDGGDGDLGLDDLGGDSGADSGEDPEAALAGDEQPLQLEDGFVDDVNSIDEFGADEPEMSSEQVVDALRAIDQIANTVLEVEGVDDKSGLTSDEEGFVLDQVDDLAASFDGEGLEGEPDSGVVGVNLDGEGSGEFDAAEDEELDSLENIGAGLVRVIVAGEPVRHPAFSSVYVTREKFGELDAVICSGLNSGDSLVLDGDADDSILDTFVCSSLGEIGKDTPLKTGYLKASAFKRWVQQSRKHRLAWRAAINQAARRLGHRPKTLPEMASVLAIASSVYDKWFSGDAVGARKVISALVGRNVGQLRRVNAALQKRSSEGKSTKVIRSDYNGYSNFVTWNAAMYLKQNAKFRDKAVAFLKSNRGASYDQLIQGIGLSGGKTPDNVAWLDRRINRDEMGDVLSFLSNSYKGNGMGGAVRSATQVDGNREEVITVQDDTPTGLSEAKKTLASNEIDGENSTRLTNVDGGDHSQTVDVHNTGDDGSLEADIDAGTEFNDSGYSFDSSKIAALELPIEGEDVTQVLDVREIGSGVYMLHQAFVAPGAGRCSFTKGAEAKAVLSRGTRPVQKIKANVDRVLTLKGSKNALLLRSSSVLGVVGIEAPFSKGLRNSKYSVFSRTGVNLVNEEGYYIPSPKGPQRVIASAVSIKAIRQGKEKNNIVAGLEQAYIQYLRSCVAKAYKDNTILRQRLDQALKAHERRRGIQSRAIEKERSTLKREIASSYADFEALRVKSAAEDAARVFSGSQEAIREEQAARKSQAERNIEYLSSLI
jgi:hypothetical protein